MLRKDSGRYWVFHHTLLADNNLANRSSLQIKDMYNHLIDVLGN